MLQELHVKNLALIKEARVEFSKGFHVLTGETGAGKSLLLGSMGLALGQKASSDMIGKDADTAIAELVFSVEDKELLKLLENMDIPVEEDGTVILFRRLQQKGSTCRINGQTTTAATLKMVAEHLIDIHGQHEHQSLLKKANHIRLLDDFAGEELSKVKEEIAVCFKNYKELLDLFNSDEMDEKAREREISLLRHESDEIEKAALKEGEAESLEELFNKMTNSKRLLEEASLVAALTGMSGMAGRENAAELIGRALRSLNQAAQLDSDISPMNEALSSVEDLLNDFNRELSEYIQSLSFDEETFAETENRLNLINSLKAKYGNTIEEIKDYYNEAVERLSFFEDYDLRRQQNAEELKKLTESLNVLCKKAHDIRCRYAKALEKQMEDELLGLNFLQGRFEVRIIQTEVYSSKGNDEVEFLISLNPGEALKPLANIASGGELSRIMLALRTIGAAKDGIDTLIFDEIDTGISGRTAEKVASKLYELSKERQVICITHLPQLAAYGDVHYLIEKSVSSDATSTKIERLDEEASLNELARLLGDTSSAIKNAKELKSKKYLV